MWDNCVQNGVRNFLDFLLTTRNWVSKEDLAIVHTIRQTIFSNFHSPVAHTAGKKKYFQRALEIIARENLHLEIVQVFKIPFLVEPTQQNIPHIISLRDQRNEKVRKCYSENQAFKKSLFEQLVFSKKERRWNRLVISRPGIEQVHTIQTL